ncbi:MAG: molybdopterin-dependent oxidoreductase [Actinobacteria bacterium]|nr:molybdopterin-dependent oxidoreductase [Actinomycetota bacterium]
MAGRRTNLALLVLLAGALVTGALAFAIGTGGGRWAVIVHGVVGLGIVALAPWKSVIARRGLRRGRGGRWASVVLAALVALTVATGVLHATGILVRVGGLTAMQVHVGAALVGLPFALWHVVARRVRPRRADLSRRALLRAGLLAGGSVLSYGALEAVVHVTGLPGVDRRFTGSHESGSFDPAAMPVTQWLDDAVPTIDEPEWRLAVSGPAGLAVASLALADLEGHDDRVTAVLDCTGGWFAEQEWSGVRLDRLLWEAGRAVGVRSVLVRSATGYSRRFPIEDAARLFLATRVGGRPLSAGHGRPARLVAPGRRGFWWVKWVTEVEVGTTPWWWQPPFPLT